MAGAASDDAGAPVWWSTVNPAAMLLATIGAGVCGAYLFVWSTVIVRRVGAVVRSMWSWWAWKIRCAAGAAVEVVGLWLSGRVLTYHAGDPTWRYIVGEPWEASSVYASRWRCWFRGHTCPADCWRDRCIHNRYVFFTPGWPIRFLFLRPTLRRWRR